MGISQVDFNSRRNSEQASTQLLSVSQRSLQLKRDKRLRTVGGLYIKSWIACGEGDEHVVEGPVIHLISFSVDPDKNCERTDPTRALSIHQ